MMTRSRSPVTLINHLHFASAESGSHSMIVAAEQLVDRSPARLHLLGGRRNDGACRPRAHDRRPTAHWPSLPGRRAVAGQPVTQGRVAPPPAERGRHRINRRTYATPDSSHPGALEVRELGGASEGVPTEIFLASQTPRSKGLEFRALDFDFEFSDLDFDFDAQPRHLRSYSPVCEFPSGFGVGDRPR
jgi:hypothetical protein